MDFSEMPTKKIVIIFIAIVVFLISSMYLRLYGDEYPVTPTSKWLSCSKEESYKIYLELVKANEQLEKAYKDLRKEYDVINKLLSNEIKENVILRKEMGILVKANRPLKFGINLSVLGGINFGDISQTMRFAASGKVGFMIFLIDRLYLGPDLEVDVFPVISGKIGITLGYCF